MDKFLLVILVILGQFLIPTSTSTYRVNINAAKIKPKSPQVVIVAVFNVDINQMSEFRNGFIVNEKTILTWGSMTREVFFVIEYKYSRSMARMIGVQSIKRHPCLKQLALMELERPLEFDQNFQPLWFHADYQNEIGQNLNGYEFWLDSWSSDTLGHDMFLDFLRTSVVPILKYSTKNLNQTQTYYTTTITKTYAYSAYEAKIDKFGEEGKNKNKSTSQCFFPCLFPGAGLFVREKGQNKSYLAGIAYPDPYHNIYTHMASDNKIDCPLNLKFLDLTKMLCWISGSVEFSPNCSNPEGYEDNCQISDINKNWRKSYFDYLTVENIVLSFIFILFCILIYLVYMIFRTRF